jgi:hypothetical protein
MTPQEIREIVEREKLEIKIHAQLARLRKLAEQSSAAFWNAQDDLTARLTALIDQSGADIYRPLPPRKPK